MIAEGEDPYRVFSDAFDVHHRPLSSWLDVYPDDEPETVVVDGEAIEPRTETTSSSITPATGDGGDLLVHAIDVPQGVELRGRWEHRQKNLGGSA